MQILHVSTFRQVRRVVFDYLKLCQKFSRGAEKGEGDEEGVLLMRAPDAPQCLTASRSLAHNGD